MLTERVEARSDAIAHLAAYTGKSYKRKRLRLGKRSHVDDALEKHDAEGEALVALEQEATSLIGVFQDAANGLEQRLNAASAKRKRANSTTTGKLSVTEVAERLRVSRNKSADVDRR